MDLPLGDDNTLASDIKTLVEHLPNATTKLYFGFFEHLVLRTNYAHGKMMWVARYHLPAPLLRELKALHDTEMLSNQRGDTLKLLDRWLDVLTPHLRLRKLALLAD